jgi:four helix bundle protein
MFISGCAQRADSRWQITDSRVKTVDERRHFRGLIHWQKAQDLATGILALVKELPKTRSYDVLGTQLLRSASSISANIAEGYGRFSPAAYRSHLSIARGSLFETQSWLDLLLRDGTISSDTAAELDRQCEELARIITSRMKALDANKGSYVREELSEYQA